MAVLFTSSLYYPNVGGVESHMKDFADYLKRSGVPTYVLTIHPRSAAGIYNIRNPAETKGFERDGILEVRRVGLINVPFLFPTVKLFLTFFIHLPLFLLRHRDVEVIHAHCSSSLAAGILFGKMLSGRRVFHTQHTPLDFHGTYRSRIMRWCLRRCDAVFSISKSVKADIVSYGVPEEKVVLFRNWTDLEKFKIVPGAKEKLGLEGKFVVHFSGRFIEEKGVRIFAEAYRLLRDDRDIVFMATGSGPLESFLKESIPIVKTVSYDELSLYYSAADLFTIPSTYVEGFARVVVEALACGTPVIGSRTGSIPEEFDETVGVLVEPGNARELANVIKKYYDSPGELARLREKVRPYAERTYSERNAEVIVREYKLSGKGG
ncbi:MAG: glycosyltransferase family 4 protein [Candidatus Altiarchaeota archaeon]|nr:glycosyltransferase family 4 protein [Candidatus Altiarchaeota archaeon]